MKAAMITPSCLAAFFSLVPCRRVLLGWLCRVCQVFLSRVRPLESLRSVLPRGQQASVGLGCARGVTSVNVCSEAMLESLSWLSGCSLFLAFLLAHTPFFPASSKPGSGLAVLRDKQLQFGTLPLLSALEALSGWLKWGFASIPWASGELCLSVPGLFSPKICFWRQIFFSSLVLV